jgi:hypothetical protein
LVRSVLSHTLTRSLSHRRRKQKCYVSLIENLNLDDVDCIKYSLSKGIGVGIVAGGSIMKVPQLLLSTSAFPPSFSYSALHRPPYSTQSQIGARPLLSRLHPRDVFLCHNPRLFFAEWLPLFHIRRESLPRNPKRVHHLPHHLLQPPLPFPAPHNNRAS